MSPKEILPSEVILNRYGKALVGKSVLITGVSNDSIAGELAIQLSTADLSLLILSARNEANVAPIIEKIRETKPNMATRFLPMDLSDLASIKHAVSTLSDVPKIDHLACVAGVMVPPYGKTKDGFETQFGVNYLANFVLVKLLLPKIQAAGPSSTISIVASGAVRGGKIDFEDISFSDGKTYVPWAAYSQSNVARVMFVKSLAEKLGDSGVRAFSIDPGAVQSGLHRHATPEFQKFIAEIKAAGGMKDVDGRTYNIPPFTTKSEGAATIVTSMIDPTIQDYNGAYLHDNAVADDELHSHILNRENWVKLWELSEKLTGDDFIV